MDSPTIETRDLTREYRMGSGSVRALDQVNITVRSGEFVALVGTSGSGKTTLLSLLGCLDRPTSGMYLLDGAPVHDLSNDDLAEIRNRKIGFVFQSFNLIEGLTALDNVALPLRYRGIGRNQRRDRARSLLASVGLEARVDHRPGQLSGGQRQRVAVARALASDPSLILADEPTGNLDTRSGDEILELFHDLHAHGRTLVLVTHDPSVASTAQRRICLEDGRVVDDDGET